MTDSNPMAFVLKLLVLVFSVIVHEVAHGYTADRLGDPTARLMNRLTLNPLPHIDPFGSIILPIFLMAAGSPIVFGAARPVPVDMRYFRNPRRGMLLVSIAGPGSNLIMAAIAGLLFRIIHPAPENPLALLFIWACLINVVLAVFNAIPVPPLDGSRVLAAFLPPQAAAAYMRLERFGLLIIFGLLYFGILGYVMHPLVLFLVTLFAGG